MKTRSRKFEDENIEIEEINNRLRFRNLHLETEIGEIEVFLGEIARAYENIINSAVKLVRKLNKILWI